MLVTKSHRWLLILSLLAGFIYVSPAEAKRKKPREAFPFAFVTQVRATLSPVIPLAELEEDLIETVTRMGGNLVPITENAPHGGYLVHLELRQLVTLARDFQLVLYLNVYRVNRFQRLERVGTVMAQTKLVSELQLQNLSRLCVRAMNPYLRRLLNRAEGREPLELNLGAQPPDDPYSANSPRDQPWPLGPRTRGRW